jgi:hypothetical protein
MMIEVIDARTFQVDDVDVHLRDHFEQPPDNARLIMHGTTQEHYIIVERLVRRDDDLATGSSLDVRSHKGDLNFRIREEAKMTRVKRWDADGATVGFSQVVQDNHGVLLRQFNLR